MLIVMLLRKYVTFFIIFAFFYFYGTPIRADEITHRLGNSGYAVRDAMHAGAAKKSPRHYRKAVDLQRMARIKFSQRYLNEAIELSRQAEVEARLALKESRR